MSPISPIGPLRPMSLVHSRQPLRPLRPVPEKSNIEPRHLVCKRLRPIRYDGPDSGPGREGPKGVPMTDYQIQPNTRRCFVTGRELKPGEKFYTVLLEEGDKFVRRDYGSESWQGPPTGAFSFWTGRVAEREGPRLPPIDDDLLVDCFHRLEGQTEPRRINFRYVVALLLMRRKRFRFEESHTAGDQEVLCVRCARSKKKYEVVHPRLTEEEMAAVQEEVFKVLGWE
jgi:hypothetical protein